MAMNSPIDAPSPSLIGSGTSRTTIPRAPLSVRTRNASPERSAMPSPVCQPMPGACARVAPSRAEPPIPGPTRKGRLAYSPIAMLPPAISRMVAVVAAPRSSPPLASSEGITATR